MTHPIETSLPAGGAVSQPADPAVDSALQDRFREVMAGVATPVSVITSIVAGFPHGTTVSAFASLSMKPPMVLVALDRGSDLLAVIQKAGRFGVNVLGVQQAAMARIFAKKGGSGKFAGVRWEIDNGLPRLPDAPGWLGCELSSLVGGGDHVIALGTIIAAETWDGRPLTYHRRIFGTHSPLDQG